MKLRIRGNSIRLRLGQSEVRALIRDGQVRETTTFAPGVRFGYALRVADDVPDLRAALVDREIVVLVPRDVARDWATSDRVGLEAEQSVGADGQTLTLLIEKDFQCLDRDDDPADADAFPHPALTPACA